MSSLRSSRRATSMATPACVASYGALGNMIANEATAQGYCGTRLRLLFTFPFGVGFTVALTRRFETGS